MKCQCCVIQIRLPRHARSSHLNVHVAIAASYKAPERQVCYVVLSWWVADALTSRVHCRQRGISK